MQLENKKSLADWLTETRNNLWTRGPDKVLTNGWAMFSIEEARRVNLPWDHILVFSDGFSLGILQSDVPREHDLEVQLRTQHGDCKWVMSKPSLRERHVEIDFTWGD